MSIKENEYPQSYYGLLAILSLGPQTGYDIRKELEHPEIFYWKESYGNIYPMLRNLEKDGLIDRHDVPFKKKKKILYELNRAGLDELNSWLLKPATLSRFRVEILMKLRFGESAGVSSMMDQVRLYREKALEELDEARNNSRMLREQTESLSTDLRLIASVYFEELKESNIRWCDQALEILEKWERRALHPAEGLDEAAAENSVFQLPRKEPRLIE